MNTRFIALTHLSNGHMYEVHMLNPHNGHISHSNHPQSKGHVVWSPHTRPTDTCLIAKTTHQTDTYRMVPTHPTNGHCIMGSPTNQTDTCLKAADFCNYLNKSAISRHVPNLFVQISFTYTVGTVCKISLLTRYPYVLFSIASTFEEMAARVSQVPETTAELVELTNFINESRDATMFDLKTQLLTTADYVMFLLSHTLLLRM